MAWAARPSCGVRMGRAMGVGWGGLGGVSCGRCGRQNSELWGGLGCAVVWTQLVSSEEPVYFAPVYLDSVLRQTRSADFTLIGIVNIGREIGSGGLEGLAFYRNRWEPRSGRIWPRGHWPCPIAWHYPMGKLHSYPTHR